MRREKSIFICHHLLNRTERLFASLVLLFIPKQTLNTSHELGSVAALTKKDTEKNQTHLTIIKVMNI